MGGFGIAGHIVQSPSASKAFSQKHCAVRGRQRQAGKSGIACVFAAILYAAGFLQPSKKPAEKSAGLVRGRKGDANFLHAVDDGRALTMILLGRDLVGFIFGEEIQQFLLFAGRQW